MARITSQYHLRNRELGSYTTSNYCRLLLTLQAKSWTQTLKSGRVTHCSPNWATQGITERHHSHFILYVISESFTNNLIIKSESLISTNYPLNKKQVRDTRSS